ncbi:S-adenosyl-L-methionine-dependent methyltransferase [Ochromonadaceae sp. CCMP2298]|nr:S-adenosyl-L-methionine-dependent methyltransferase [Ochromonadaceae sp. CCMP2298]
MLSCSYTLIRWVEKALWTPSRTYSQEENSVGREYDAWEEEGILEYYWGEHIHLGYYQESVRAKSALLPPSKNFIQAKYDFIDEMLKFGRFELASKPQRILDVGCGIGGTSRYLAKKFGPETSVTGITLSQNQANRASALALEQGVPNAQFRVMDALAMEYADDTFDYVWACESGEHMPDKKKYVEEMTRVLKPGGKIVIATWCQRDEGNRPFDSKEKRMLNFLYSEWTHPFFISITDYQRLMLGTGLTDIVTDDWTPQTIARYGVWLEWHKRAVFLS